VSESSEVNVKKAGLLRRTLSDDQPFRVASVWPPLSYESTTIGDQPSASLTLEFEVLEALRESMDVVEG
jgi:hypothetical protein